MTVSFHKYGEYFPGTGELRDVGVGKGKYYAVNFPLRDGINDDSYKNIFEPIIQHVMDWYRPGAVVLQCGGDSLSGDRLGCFNLSMKGHANCVKFVQSFGLPVLVLGGGGYTMRNVARTWAYETGLLVGQDLPASLPYNEYYEYFAPDYELDVRSSNMDNANSTEYLNKIKTAIIENLSRTKYAPSVQMQDTPRDIPGLNDVEEQDAELDDLDEDENKDVRKTQRQSDKQIERQDEFSDSDDDEESAGLGISRQPDSERRRGIMDYQNPNAAADDQPTNGEPAPPQELATNRDADAGSDISQAGEDVTMQDDPETEPAIVRNDSSGASPHAERDEEEDIQMQEAEKNAGRAERVEEDEDAEARTEAAS